jgi:hypothetical protein
MTFDLPYLISPEKESKCLLDLKRGSDCKNQNEASTAIVLGYSFLFISL